jgi:hypothetical protein
MRKLSVRAAVAAFLGILVGLHIYSDYARWNRLGVDAFLDFETNRFNKSMAHLRPEAITLISCCLIVLFAAGVYELIVAGIWKLAKPRQS